MEEQTRNAEGEQAPTFPTAEIQPRRKRLQRLFGTSRMWWATLAALAIAVFFVWQAIEQTGPAITIRFPEGHGLKVGDFVRHRGIDVGHVDQIALADDLESVEVRVTLLHGAEGLAREGSRFWIVRPQLSLTEVRGLDTAVGAKYVAVVPGDPNGKQEFVFDGLAVPPPGDLDGRGMEIVLRGEASFGLYEGAPLTWRGVDVGQVLSVDLANDTRYVDVRARISAAYRNLVRSNSRFWVARGLGIDAGLTGFTLKAESLTTIARGGVSFITPADDSAQPVGAGHVFTLHAEEDADWTKEASTVSLIDFPLPPTVKLRSRWKEKSFGFTRRREQETVALLLDGTSDRAASIIAPETVMSPPAGALADSWQVEIIAPGRAALLARVATKTKTHPLGEGVAKYVVAPQEAFAEFAIAPDNVRTATAPEDCCLVRSVPGTGGPSSVIHPLSRTELAAVDGIWHVDTSGGDLEDWHGAAVVSAADGKVIGMFLSTDAGPVVTAISK